MRGQALSPTVEDSVQVQADGSALITNPKVMVNGNANLVAINGESPSGSFQGICMVYGYKMGVNATLAYSQAAQTNVSEFYFDFETNGGFLDIEEFDQSNGASGALVVQTLTCK